MNVQEVINVLSRVPNPSVTEVMIADEAQIAATGDFTGGTPEDKFTATAHGLTAGDRLRLVSESAAGVVNGAVGDIFYALVTDANVFQLSLTAGGAAVENSADGTAVFARQDLTVDDSGVISGGIDLEDGGVISLS